MQTGLAFLRKTLPGYTLRSISPPKSKKAPVLTAEDRLLYKERWEIEEIFRELKDFWDRFD